MTIRTILFLPLLLILVSCSKKGDSTTATLEISRGFAITNPSFAGGLIISGRTDQGLEFSRYIMSGSSLNIILPKSTWTISAVGWDGGPSPEKVFGGNPHCGTVTKTLVNNTETIDLVVNVENCKQTYFSGQSTFVDTNVTPNTLKPLNFVNTCGTFFLGTLLPSSPLDSYYIKSATLDDACDATTVPDDLQSAVRAIKIRSVEINTGVDDYTAGMESGCMGTGGSSSLEMESSNSGYANHGVRLPYANVPLMILTYSDADCNSLIATYPFLQGLSADYSSTFDHLIMADTSNSHMKIWLPGNESRRAKSPFLALMPSVLKSDGTKFELAPDSDNYVFHGLDTVENTFIVEDEHSCSAPSLVSSNPTITASCTDLGDSVEISYQSTTSGTGTITNTNGPIQVHTYSNVSTTSDQSRLRWESQRALLDLMGNNNSHFFQFGAKPLPVDLYNYGVLSLVRYWLGPEGVGQAFDIPETAFLSDPSVTFQSFCSELTSDMQEHTFYNPQEMQFETWGAALYNERTSEPGSYICNAGTVYEPNCTTSGDGFEKRLVIFDYAVSTISPVVAVEFSCSHLIGRFEINTFEEEGYSRSNFRKILSWNTDLQEGINDVHKQRFEHMELNNIATYVSGQWVTNEVEHSMAQFEKTGSNSFTALNLRFHSKARDDGRWDETLHSLNFQSSIESTSLTEGVCVGEIRGEAISTESKGIFDSSSSATHALPTSIVTGYELEDTDWDVAKTTFCDNQGITTLFSRSTSMLDDDLVFKLSSLNDTTFLNKFQGSFLLSP